MLTAGNGTARPDPEVLDKPKRRRFTAEYKARVLREYEASPKGERGAFLRREGLYSSHIARRVDAGVITKTITRAHLEPLIEVAAK